MFQEYDIRYQSSESKVWSEFLVLITNSDQKACERRDRYLYHTFLCRSKCKVTYKLTHNVFLRVAGSTHRNVLQNVLYFRIFLTVFMSEATVLSLQS